MKLKLKCATPAKAQVNFRKHQRQVMNKKERLRAQQALELARRLPMWGADGD